MPASKVKVAIAKVLKDEGYIEGFKVSGEETRKPQLEIALKYYAGRPVIEKIERVSKPGPAHLQEQGRHPARDERPRHRHRLDVARRDDRPQGARHRRRRRSALHRRLTGDNDMSRIGNNPVQLPPKVEVTLAHRRDLGQGPARHAVAQFGAERHRRAERRGRSCSRRRTTTPSAMQGTLRALVANMVKGVTAGLREEADAGRRRLSRAGAGRQDQPVARLLAPGRAHDAQGREGRRRRRRPRSWSRASTSSRSARSPPRSAPTVRPSRTRARACATRTSASMIKETKKK